MSKRHNRNTRGECGARFTRVKARAHATSKTVGNVANYNPRGGGGGVWRTLRNPGTASANTGTEHTGTEHAGTEHAGTEHTEHTGTGTKGEPVGRNWTHHVWHMGLYRHSDGTAPGRRALLGVDSGALYPHSRRTWHATLA